MQFVSPCYMFRPCCRTAVDSTEILKWWNNYSMQWDDVPPIVLLYNPWSVLYPDSVSQFSSSRDFSISVDILSFFPWRWHFRTETRRHVPSVGNCIHCGDYSCRCDYAMRTGGRSDNTCLAGCCVTLRVRDSSYRRRKVQAAHQNANSVCVRAFDIIRTVVLKTKIDRFVTGPFCEIWSRGALPKLCWDWQ